MLKEFFLVDYGSINSFKNMSAPLLDMATSSFLLIAAIFELFKGFVGKSNVESRVTIFILAAISMTVFTQYNQKVLDISFETSDKILSTLHITSMTKISDVMKSSPGEEIEKNNSNKTSKSKKDTTASVLSEARVFMANNLAIGIAWLISVVAIGLSRVLFTVIYYALIVLAPVIIFISVFPGFEGSLKTFWQTFIWCFFAPIVFSVIFVLMHLIAQKENQGTGLESLVGVLLYGIFLVGSFVMTYKISTSAPISGFAEKASMMGAMVMAAPFTGMGSLAQSAMTNPVQSFGRMKETLGRAKGGIEKLSNRNLPHNGISDISKLSNSDLEKKLGKEGAGKIYSERVLKDYYGNKYGLSNSGSSSITKLDSTKELSPNGTSLISKATSGARVNETQVGHIASVEKSNSTASLKSQYLMGVSNIEPNYQRQGSAARPGGPGPYKSIQPSLKSNDQLSGNGHLTPRPHKAYRNDKNLNEIRG